LTNGYCSSNQLNSLSLSTKRENDAENSRGVLARVSAVCVDSLVTGINCFTGIRAGFDGATGFEAGGRRKGAGRANRLAGCDGAADPPVSFEKKN
jgi:hypothetical protein